MDAMDLPNVDPSETGRQIVALKIFLATLTPCLDEKPPLNMKVRDTPKRRTNYGMAIFSS